MTREETVRNLLTELIDMIDNGSQRDLDRADEIGASIIKLFEQEPRKGHWRKTLKAVMGEGYMWYCDKCNHEVYQDSSRSYPSENFCSNCGSDNREVEE